MISAKNHKFRRNRIFRYTQLSEYLSEDNMLTMKENLNQNLWFNLLASFLWQDCLLFLNILMLGNQLLLLQESRLKVTFKLYLFYLLDIPSTIQQKELNLLSKFLMTKRSDTIVENKNLSALLTGLKNKQWLSL